MGAPLWHRSDSNQIYVRILTSLPLMGSMKMLLLTSLSWRCLWESLCFKWDVPCRLRLFEYIVDSWCQCLGRVWRCGPARGSMSLMLQKSCSIPNLISLCLLLVGRDVSLRCSCHHACPLSYSHQHGDGLWSLLCVSPRQTVPPGSRLHHGFCHTNRKIINIFFSWFLVLPRSTTEHEQGFPEVTGRRCAG